MFKCSLRLPIPRLAAFLVLAAQDLFPLFLHFQDSAAAAL